MTSSECAGAALLDEWGMDAFVVEDAALLAHPSIFWPMRGYARSGARAIVLGGVRHDVGPCEAKALVLARMEWLGVIGG